MKSLDAIGTLILSVLFSLFVASWALAGEDAYFDLPVDHLTLTEGKLPNIPLNDFWLEFERDQFSPYAVIDGTGEVYTMASHRRPLRPDGVANPLPYPHICIHTPDRREITGRIYLVNGDRTGTVELKFKIAASEATADAKKAFFLMMEDHYEQLLHDGVPGAAWFRFRAREARKALGAFQDHESRPWQNRPQSLDDTYALFTGNQALAENLQLEKALPAGASRQGENEVDVDSIPGISVAAIDWKGYIKGKNPALDPLAADIPADQHAIFFHTFDSLIALADEADRNGTPVLQFAETRSEDAGTRSRYERQLGLSLTGLGRLLGPKLVNSVAITGSDSYLRAGSDLAILFTPKEGDALKTLLTAQLNAAKRLTPDAKDVEGKIGGLSYTGVRSPDRSLSAYLAVLKDGAVVVSNSPAQLARLAAVQDGKADPLSKTPEYTFFRDRYKLGDDDESALLLLSDATIRRWCSARWRIADSRRTRAAALLADLDAKNLDSLVAGKIEPGAVYGEFPVPGLGDLRMTANGASSANYGSPGFFTPISEMTIDKVTVAEADAYKRWRDTYETNWRGIFDPIAVRLHVSRKKLAADLTALPLIYDSTYRPLIDVASGAKLDLTSSDLHDSVFRYGLSINVNSAQVKAAAMFATQLAPNLKIDPFGWVGQSLWVYGDNGPFWSELAASGDADKYLQSHLANMPFGLRVQVSNGFKLTAFLVAAHAFIDQSAPGMTVWDNLRYKDQPYVKVSPSAQAKGQNKEMENISIYYQATGDALLITLNEGMLKGAIDRQLDREEAKKAGKEAAPANQPLLGENLVFQANPTWLDFMDHFGRKPYQTWMQKQSWSNLPILNEWKHRYPDQDPLKLYERYFHSRLIDPAGGQYVWNDKWQTMESTIYGSPAQPKEGQQGIAVLKGLLRANLGVTFENDGIRARTEIDRAEK